MAIKKQRKYKLDNPEEGTAFTEASGFYFGKENYKWMLIGLVCILIGFLLMLGYDANTRPDGTVDPTYWNSGIFSIVRIRIAPLLVIVGFAIEVYAILKRKD